MIKVSNIETFGWEAAIRGLRNPMSSWRKSDSEWVCDELSNEEYKVGKNDFDLMKRLTEAGSEHRKFLRMIHVQMDVLAPLYWYKEMDTYKVGTTANSTSTMHKIHATIFTRDNLSTEHLDAEELDILDSVIYSLNFNRDKFLKTKDKKYWWHMIQMLPSSYNQLRTLDFNYETALNIIRQRSGHKLDEWRKFTNELLQLPYMEELYDAMRGLKNE